MGAPLIVCTRALCAEQWGQNSGHVGVPLENMPAFITKLQQLYQKTTGTAMKKSPGAGGPKATIGKGAKAKKEEKKGAKEKKPKEVPAPKKSLEELDAELTSYTAQRNADDDVPVEEAAPVEAA